MCWRILSAWLSRLNTSETREVEHWSLQVRANTLSNGAQIEKKLVSEPPGRPGILCGGTRMLPGQSRDTPKSPWERSWEAPGPPQTVARAAEEILEAFPGRFVTINTSEVYLCTFVAKKTCRRAFATIFECLYVHPWKLRCAFRRIFCSFLLISDR